MGTMEADDVTSTVARATGDEASSSASETFPFVPWRFMGMGLLIAWLCCTHLPGLFVAGAGLETGAGAAADTLVDYLMRVGDIGTFVVVALLGTRLGPISRYRLPCAGLVIACALITAALPYLAHMGAPAWLLGALSIVAGAGGAVLFLLWAEVYCQLGPTRSVLYGAGACLLAGVVALLVANLSTDVSRLAIGALPLGAGLLAIMSLSHLPGEHSGVRDASASGTVRYPVPWKIILLMACAGFVSGFAGSLLVSADGIGAVHRIAATALFGALLLALFVARRGSFDVRLFAWIALPVALASFVAIPVLGTVAGMAVSFLVKFSYVAFALFVLLVLANMVWRHDIPSARVFAFARASSEGAMFAGILLRRALQASGALDNQATMWLITILGLVGIVGCVVLWHSERSVTADWGAMGVDPASGLHVPSARETLLARCDELAGAHGLTPRESEVLALLAQGREPAQVEQELFLSHNTLKTHLRHLYAKLDVHTREELVAAVTAPESR